MIVGKDSHIPFLQPHYFKIITPSLTWENSFNSYFSVELPFTVLKNHYQSELHYFLYAVNLSLVPVTNLQASAALQLMNQSRTFLLNCDLMISSKNLTEVLHD